MKKLLVIFTLLLYGFSSTGMTLQLHYCCGKLKSIEWQPVQKSDCGSKHKMGSKPCCETKEFSNKQKADQELHQQAIKNFSLPVVGVKPHTEVVFQPVIHQQPLTFTGTSPPLPGSPIFIRNCVFRI